MPGGILDANREAPRKWLNAPDIRTKWLFNEKDSVVSSVERRTFCAISVGFPLHDCGWRARISHLSTEKKRRDVRSLVLYQQSYCQCFLFRRTGLGLYALLREALWQTHSNEARRRRRIRTGCHCHIRIRSVSRIHDRFCRSCHELIVAAHMDRLSTARYRKLFDLVVPNVFRLSFIRALSG